MNTNAKHTPVKGMRFYHSRVLDTRLFDGKTPQLFQVTRIARGTVYYKAVIDYGTREELVGNSQCCEVKDFHKWVHSLTSAQGKEN